MRIKNEEIYKLIAELWNAEACATDARERDWCAESVRAEVRASGMMPDEALRGAVSTVCTVFAATVARSHRLEEWLEADDGDEGDDGDEDYDDDEDDGDEEYDDDEDDDVVHSCLAWEDDEDYQDADGDGDYVEDDEEE